MSLFFPLSFLSHTLVSFGVQPANGCFSCVATFFILQCLHSLSLKFLSNSGKHLFQFDLLSALFSSTHNHQFSIAVFIHWRSSTDPPQLQLVQSDLTLSPSATWLLCYLPRGNTMDRARGALRQLLEHAFWRSLRPTFFHSLAVRTSAFYCCCQVVACSSQPVKVKGA